MKPSLNKAEKRHMIKYITTSTVIEEIHNSNFSKNLKSSNKNKKDCMMLLIIIKKHIQSEFVFGAEWKIPLIELLLKFC